VDPSSKALQGVAAQVANAASATASGREAEARVLLDRAAVELGAVLRAALVTAPARVTSGEVDRLEGALVDALRRPGGKR
jgi:hypothetical protein